MENNLKFTMTEAEVLSAIISEYQNRRGWTEVNAQQIYDRLYHHYRVGLNKWLDGVWKEKAPADIVELLSKRNPEGPKRLAALGYGFGVIDVSQQGNGNYTYMKHVCHHKGRILSEWTFQIKGFRAVNQEAKAEINNEVVKPILPVYKTGMLGIETTAAKGELVKKAPVTPKIILP